MTDQTTPSHDLVARARKAAASVKVGAAPEEILAGNWDNSPLVQGILSALTEAAEASEPVARPQGLHPSHKTRFSFDASSYDEICEYCGHTDRLGSWGKLSEPCPSHPQPSEPAERIAKLEEALRLSTTCCGISRLADNDKALLLSFRDQPTDDDMRRLHDASS